MDYSSLNVKQLKEECKRRNIYGYSRLKKNELINVLTTNYVREDTYNRYVQNIPVEYNYFSIAPYREFVMTGYTQYHPLHAGQIVKAYNKDSDNYDIVSIVIGDCDDYILLRKYRTDYYFVNHADGIVI